MIVEYNHKIEQKSTIVFIPRKIARHISVLKPIVKKQNWAMRDKKIWYGAR